MGPLWKMLGPLGRANKAGASEYLFNDSFDTDGAVTAGARTAVPGPGTATITDSAGVWSSITGGILTPSKKTEVASEPRYVAQTFSYVPGRALIANVAWLSLGGVADKTVTISFHDIETDAYFRCGCYWQDYLKIEDYGSIWNVGMTLPAAGTYLQIAVVLQDNTVTPFSPEYYPFYEYTTNGGFYFFVNKKLRYVSLWGWPNGFNNLKPTIKNSWSTGAPRNPSAVDYIRIKDLGVPFSNGSFATVDVRPPEWNTPYTADAEGVYQFIFNTDSLAPTGTPELRFRIQDDDNYWRAHVDIATGKYCLDSVAAGVATRRITAANAYWYPGEYWAGFRIETEGTTVKLWSQAWGGVTYEGSVTLDHCTTATGVKVLQSDTDYTPRSLVCYPLSSPVYDEALG